MMAPAATKDIDLSPQAKSAHDAADECVLDLAAPSDTVTNFWQHAPKGAPLMAND